jgi:molybdopterin-guanine dinucleotide biosynthesis protein A
LGAIVAGGLSRRFGSDKARATIGGTAMLDRVAARLAPQCAGLIVVGRDWPGIARVEDCPAPGLGPLGGLAGALVYARTEGYDTVLTSGCDLPGLPDGLVTMLSPADAVIADQPTIGLWRTDRADVLMDWLARTERRSIRAWVEQIGARRVAAAPIANVNRPEDLAAIEAAALSLSAGPRSSR